MDIGFCPIGMASTADPVLIAAIARKTEEVGFSSLWTGDHVVFTSEYSSAYPYSADGRAPLPSTKIDFLDPFTCLAYAAAHTERIRLGIGVTIVPLHNPIELAKSVASIDKLSNGRFIFGVGIGWLAEEFDALGTPWPRRGARTNEYLRAMKELWAEEDASFDGEFCSFSGVQLFPKPVQRPHPPYIIGGNSDAALRRAAQLGDGWYGYELPPADAKDCIQRIEKYATDAGRDPGTLRYVVSPGYNQLDVAVRQLEQYHEAGVHEVLFTSIQVDADLVDRNIEEIAEQLIPAAQALA